ncbi:cyclopropane-fatty-acyl-phospholipid synthase family protein [Frateuria edaphi]|uniref:SAM-dependent methyltransferase n=1 Tax=Frateuria edaphi TaxID=2898793 RepID=UPI001E6109B9|nr:cyclopropane-fatty-acyl-phospholipid synthase family protein [Frateuria edaphi]UGB47476.1 cyclopropane-fatty-acyl-phospholipid synthase family protein [Frateuria edaphi]
MPTATYGALDRALRSRLLAQMVQLRGCRLVLTDALGRVELGQPAEGESLLRVQLQVDDPRFYRLVAANGSVGAGEAYIEGLWRCDDPVALVRIMVRNRDLLDGMESGLARLGGLALKAWHALNRNTKNGSRRNIAAHYDLGNRLFGLFLSEDLMYSSAIFARPDESLESASRRKLERICQKLALGPDDHVLEIGTGWGGFAVHAATHHGCRVTTTTISQEQYDLARQRVRDAGLDDRVTVLLQDYRDLSGKYDKLVSIEMIEAIGAAYMPAYFAAITRLLEHDGLALIQAITVEDHRYAQALKSVDYIKRYIFPGSFIPAVSAMLEAARRSSDLRLFHLEDIGPSYALTLKAWRERFMARRADVLAAGYDARFIRMWEFYLAYCEGGFRERSIGDVQMLLTRPGCRRESYLPDLGLR